VVTIMVSVSRRNRKTACLRQSFLRESERRLVNRLARLRHFVIKSRKRLMLTPKPSGMANLTSVMNYQMSLKSLRYD